METAASRAGEGLYTAGRGIANHSLHIGWRAWEGVVDSGRRAYVALRVYRGERYACARPPVEYGTAGVVVGLAAAAAVGTIVRVARRGPEGGPGGGRKLADAVLAAAGAITASRSGGDRPAAPRVNRAAPDSGGVTPLAPTARHAAGMPGARSGPAAAA
ncbi:hypothetical protein [Pilimelia anulata]|uniref:hypothetical protein n=1 Tax=Pilimelia anulata TaxID=53371 RepID=UPI00166AD0D0|nr:hypothetical protein [Pilimelia anulata]